jgi:nitric oxide dioxygenase
MMSMLEARVESHPQTPVHFLYACENAQQHSFSHRVSDLKNSTPLLHSYSWYADNTLEQDNVLSGLINLGPLAQELLLTSGNIYICGPSGFMKLIKNQLLDLGVKDAQIHYEVFGPHSDV